MSPSESHSAYMNNFQRWDDDINQHHYYQYQKLDSSPSNSLLSKFSSFMTEKKVKITIEDYTMSFLR